jgi:hypothetical protein
MQVQDAAPFLSLQFVFEPHGEGLQGIGISLGTSGTENMD